MILANYLVWLGTLSGFELFFLGDMTPERFGLALFVSGIAAKFLD